MLPIALAVIMVSLGMNLTTADFGGLASGDTALMHGRNAAAPALA